MKFVINLRLYAKHCVQTQSKTETFYIIFIPNFISFFCDIWH